MSIARRAVRGAAVTIATSIGSRALGLVGTLLLTRFVDPGEYGETAVAYVIVATAHQLLTLGLGQYVVAHPRAGRDVAFHCTFYTMVLGFISMGTIVAFRMPLGPIFSADAPLMGRFIPGMALMIMFDRLCYMPERLLVRDLRFRAIGVSRTIGELSYTAVSVAFAWLGWGGQAIVLGNIARSGLRALILCGSVNRKDWLSPSRLSIKTTRDLLAFGVPLSIGANAAFAARRWDNIIVSRFYGKATAGAYALAYNLADIPAVQVGEQIGDVLLPSYAHLEHEKRKQALVRSTTLLGLMLFPLAVGLGAVSETVVNTFFASSWAPVAPMLAILSALSIARPMGWTVSSYLQARQKPKTVMALEVGKLALLLACMLTLGRLGSLAACSAVGVAFGIHALVSWYVLRRLDGISMRRILKELSLPLIACLPMVGAVLGIRHLLAGLPANRYGLGLAAEILGGGAVYVVAALLIARRASRDFLGLLQQGFLRKRESAEVATEPPPGP